MNAIAHPFPETRLRIRKSDADRVKLINPDSEVLTAAKMIADEAARFNRALDARNTELSLLNARMIFDNLVRQIEALEPRLMASPLPEGE